MSDRLTLKHLAFLALGLAAGWMVCEWGPWRGQHIASEERRLSASLHYLTSRHTADSSHFAAQHHQDSLALDSARARQGVSGERVMRFLRRPPPPAVSEGQVIANLPVADTTALLARLDSADVAFGQHLVADSAERAANDRLRASVGAERDSALSRYRVAADLAAAGLVALRRASRRGLGDAVGLQGGYGVDGRVYAGLGFTLSVQRVACLALPTC